MRTSSARGSVFALGLGLAAIVAAQPRTSHAAIFEGLAPSGAGTEEVDSEGHRKLLSGWEADGALGTGFSDTYGLGIAGRVGYTLPMGVYLGGEVQAYWGQTYGSQNAHATFFGAEAGYKLYPLPNALAGLEFRPYVFGGPAFISASTSEAPFVRSKTGFAVQPGALTAYHLGPAFIGADFRMLTTPSPFGVALFGTAGAGF
ncbi:MAG TPA: hypothetical protein VN894_21240 [Polyangiaceae bacterium]|nr:hypothetical protein [Polyangiaceae bacterium]